MLVKHAGAMIIYQAYIPETKERVVDLLNYHWKFDEIAKARTFFEWRYEDNPYVDSPSVYIAREGDKIVGLRCFVIQKFQRTSHTLLMACPADAIVHPGFRRRGILQGLTSYSTGMLQGMGVAIILSLSSNKASAAMAHKLGWKELGRTRYMYRASLSGLLATKAVKLPRTTQIKHITMRISPTTRPNIEMSTLYPKVRENQFRNLHDQAYYSWRYKNPIARYYVVLAQDGGLSGYVIVERLNKRMFSVMEYGFDNARILNAMMTACSRHLGASMLRVVNINLSATESDCFREAGFLYEPCALLRLLKKHRVGPLACVVVPDSDQVQYPWSVRDLSGESSWYLVGADVH